MPLRDPVHSINDQHLALASCHPAKGNPRAAALLAMRSFEYFGWSHTLHWLLYFPSQPVIDPLRFPCCAKLYVVRHVNLQEQRNEEKRQQKERQRERRGEGGRERMKRLYVLAYVLVLFSETENGAFRFQPPCRRHGSRSPP